MKNLYCDECELIVLTTLLVTVSSIRLGARTNHMYQCLTLLDCRTNLEFGHPTHRRLLSGS